MGFPGLSNSSVGLFTIMIINAAMSMALLKELLRSFIQFLTSVFAHHDPSADDPSPSLTPPPDELTSSSLWDEIRSSLPYSSFAHSTEENPGHHPECAICLLDFVPGDSINILPQCEHIFHQTCIAKWLDHQQTTCPLCRSSLISEDLTLRLRRHEQEVVEELVLWFSSFHGSAFNGLW